MNITDKNTLKSWFLRGMKPLESQFAAWIDAYWHKSEQIPTSSIDGLEATLNSKAEAADIRNLTNEFATHRDDNTRHKTAEEQAKLDNLANNANLTYATKEEISILLDNGAIIIPIDFTKIRTERLAEARAAWALYPKNYIGKPFYILFKFFDNAGSWKLTELVLCKQPVVYDEDNENERQAEAILASPILTQDDIAGGITEKKARKLSIYWTEQNLVVTEVAFSKLVPVKSFNLYFFPEGKFPWDWPEYCAANQSVEVTGVLTKYSNETLVPCDRWDDLYHFMKNDKVNENRIPPICLRTITSGTIELLKPAMIEPKGGTMGGGATNMFSGLNFRTCCIEVVNGERCFVEETLNIPKFTGYGSAYTYKFTVTPCNAEHEDNSAIIIPVDFTKGTAEMETELVKLIRPFFDDGTIYKKPVYLQYIYKDDYASPDAPLKYCLVPKTKEKRTVILTEYYFNSSVSVSEPDYPEYKDAWCFLFRLTKTGVSVSMNGYTEDVPVEVIRLIEDGNYVLNAADRNWNKLYDELNKGNRPLLSLKTPESGAYCPVMYEFTPLTPATTPDVSYQGKIEISYLKETDGVMEMWVETRVFSAFNGQASSYDYPHIKKYPCKPDVRVVTEYPTDLSGVADGTIFIKNPGAV